MQENETQMLLHYTCDIYIYSPRSCGAIRHGIQMILLTTLIYESLEHTALYLQELAWLAKLSLKIN